MTSIETNTLTKTRVAAIVVNYRTAHMTIACLESLKRVLDKRKDKIVIVDNLSDNDDVQVLNRWIEKKNVSGFVSIITSKKNGGFSSGNNLGIRSIDAEYYLLANSDTIFGAYSVEELIKVANTNKKVGIVSPRLESENGNVQLSCFRFPSVFSEFINAAQTGIITRLLKRYNVPLQPSHQPSQPDWTSFACVLIRYEVFQEIGLLDECFFMYFEDVDFCKRAHKAGYEILHWPFASVIHLGGQSSEFNHTQSKKQRLPSFYYHSRAHYFCKFFGSHGLIAMNLFRVLGRSISIIKELLLKKERCVPLYQHRDIWKKPSCSNNF